MHSSQIPPIFMDAYTLFVKVWALTPDTPADVAEAILDSLDNYLLSLADKSIWFPSPYGGAIAIPTVDEAIPAAMDLISALASDGIEVSVAICRGRLDRVLAVDRWNITALAMNFAARLASVEEAKRHIIVDPSVRQDAVLSNQRFATLFGEERSGQVKRTPLRYHLIQTTGYIQVGDLEFLFQRQPDATPAPLASIVCFDIERYSERSPADQNYLVESLNKCVEMALSTIRVQPGDFGPAGDGGYIAFLPDTGLAAAVAWAFTEDLIRFAQGFQIPLRVGISAGPVRKSRHRPAVGGAVLRADQVSSVAPSGGIATVKDYWFGLPEPMKTGWYTTEVAEVLGVLSISRKPSPQPHLDATPNPKPFYSGGPATAADIAADLDIPRTQYVHTWTNENGEPQPAWRSLLFSQAVHESSKAKNRVVVLYGHRGSGKTTLCRRMIHDLKIAGIPTLDLLSEPLDLATSELFELQPQTDQGVTLVFVEIEEISNEKAIQGFSNLLKHLAISNCPFAVYLTIDTNKWKQIEGRLGSTTRFHGCTLNQRRLRGQLDEEELSGLIQRLKTHRCLFRLEHKSDETIWFVFSRKSKRDLLTVLIEATRGTEEREDLEAILWDEFVGLSQKAQWAYAFVATFQAFSIPVPRDILEHSLVTLTGDRAYFASPAFIAETADIIIRQPRGTYSARHPLIAETLLSRLRSPDWEDYKLRILCAAFRSLQLSGGSLDARHDAFFEVVNDRKVARVLTDLEALVEELDAERLPNIQGRNISRLLNSIIRVHQGRGHYDQGKKLATESLRLWDHIGNQASYLGAFCDYKLGNKSLARKAANNLLKANDYPHHVLHGIALLCVLQAWREADDALNRFEQVHGAEKTLFANYLDLRRKIDLFTKVGWSDSDFGSLAPARQLEKIEIDLEETADEETVILRYQTLVRSRHDFFRAFLAFFRYLYSVRPDEDDAVQIKRMQRLEAECRYHIQLHDENYLNYPKDVLSLLYCNIGRSMFKIDYLTKGGYPHQSECEEYFQKAIRVKPQNWYAHNWYGTFLKDTKTDRPAAEHHYSLAVAGEKGNPVFKYNLALLLFREDTFVRKRLDRARENALDALSLCGSGSDWKDFAYWPQNLLRSLDLLLSRSDLKEGQPLDPEDTMPSDPE